MDLALQKKLLSIFHYALNPNGFLVLGQAETIGAQAALFSLVDKKFRIHRKRMTPDVPAATVPMNYPVTPAAKKMLSEPPSIERALQSEVTRIINDRFSPPAVVIDADMQIVQFRGQTGAFLEPAPGEASLHLLKMAKEGLLYGLRSGIHAARKSRAPVRKTDLQIHDGKAWTRVAIEVVPLSAAGRTHYLVLFEPEPRRGAAGTAAKSASTAAAARGRRKSGTQIQFLERELAASREY